MLISILSIFFESSLDSFYAEGTEGTSSSKQNQDVVEETEGTRKPEDVMTALQITFHEDVFAKVESYWKMIDYSGPKLSMSDIEVKVDQGKIKVKAKCLICLKRFVFNTLENRSFSLYNYKKHTSLF